MSTGGFEQAEWPPCISIFFQGERRGCAAEVAARLPQVEVGQGVPQRRHRRQ